MPLDLRLEFKLNPKQRAFVESKKPWTAFVGGVGSGKTHAGAIKAIIAAFEEPGSLGLILAPTYTMLHDSTQRKFFDLLPKEAIQSYNKNREELVLVNGTTILFRSMDDPEKIRGINAAWGWLDEAALAGYHAWVLVKQRIGRQDAKRFRRRAWLTTTPKGRDGYYVEFVKNPTPEHFIVRSSSHENAMNLPENYVAGMGLTGAFYQQEVEGKFEAFTGLVYLFYPDPDDETLPYHHVMEIPRTKRFRRVIGGVDWGYSNPAVALVFGIDGDLRVWQMAEFYERYAQLEANHIPQIIAFTKEYGVEAWYCDPAEPEHIQKLKDALDNAQIDCEVYQADNTITTGIQTVQRFLALRGDDKPGLIVDESCVHTISEFTQYQYARDPDAPEDAFVKEKPVKHNDHAMDAVRYALHTALGDVIPATPFLATRTQEQRGSLAQAKKIVERTPDDWFDDEDDFQYRRDQMMTNLRFIERITGGGG